MRYMIVDNTTGRVEGECSICKLGTCCDASDIERFDDANHKIIEITDEEHLAVVASVRVDENFKVETTALPDMGKAAKFLKDRVQIDVPIEIDGPGGKEIIGFDKKPESIITEKTKEIEVIKTKTK